MANPDYTAYEHDSLHLDPTSPFFLDHVSRYWWAANFAEGRDVLDCACGKGYGSYILSKKAKSVTGIDLNTESLKKARENFRGPGLEFLEKDVFEMKEWAGRFDLITAFEIIEHLKPEKTDAFLAALKTALKPGGTLLLSTPNHDVVLKSGSQVPEFHINNFRATELKAALRNYFSDVQMLGQFTRRQGLQSLLFDLDFFNLRHSLLRRFIQKPRTNDAGLNQKVRGTFSFNHPPEGYESYRFSPRHWRQAGLTIAVCKNL